MRTEMPKELSGFVDIAKQAPEYKKKILSEKIYMLCGAILEGTKNALVIREYEETVVVLNLRENEVPNNGDSASEIEFRIAFDPDDPRFVDNKDYSIVFTWRAELKNRKGKSPSIKELKEYLETMEYFKEEFDLDRRNIEKP